MCLDTRGEKREKDWDLACKPTTRTTLQSREVIALTLAEARARAANSWAGGKEWKMGEGENRIQ